ncbi:DUF6603 domain-containing protein [Streptomyces sp. x-19]|uniref:DUF6603 domain-containing protein n=1 Tax=Streptomyces sp. x-19 TaxID=2789280 RepID=UPI00397F5567
MPETAEEAGLLPVEQNVRPGEAVTFRYTVPSVSPGHRVAVYHSGDAPWVSGEENYGYLHDVELDPQNTSGSVVFPAGSFCAPGEYRALLLADGFEWLAQAPATFTVTEQDPTLDVIQAVVSPGATIRFKYSTPVANRRNWIGLYAADHAPEESGVDHGLPLWEDWVYAPDSNGEVRIPAPVQEGEYLGFFFEDDGYFWLTEAGVPVTVRGEEAPGDSLQWLLRRAGAPDAAPPRPLVPALSDLTVHRETESDFAATAHAASPGGTDAHVVVVRTTVDGRAADVDGSLSGVRHVRSAVMAVVEAGTDLDAAVLPLLGLVRGAVTVPHVRFVYCSAALSAVEVEGVNAVIGGGLPAGTPLLPVVESGYGAGWSAVVTHQASGAEPGLVAVPWDGEAASWYAGPVKASALRSSTAGRGAVEVRQGPVGVDGVRARFQEDGLHVHLDCTVQAGTLQLVPERLGFALSLEGDGFVPRVTLEGAVVTGGGERITVDGPLGLEDGTGSSVALVGTVAARIELVVGEPPLSLPMSACWVQEEPGEPAALLLYAEQQAAGGSGAVAGGLYPMALSGVSAGFGAHTDLRLPVPGAEGTFPLVQRLDTPAGEPALTARQVLDVLRNGQWLVVQQGGWWMAGGVEYSIYGYMHARGLLAAETAGSGGVVARGRETLRFPPTRTLVPTAHVNTDYVLLQNADQGLLYYDTTAGPGSYFMDSALRIDGGVSLQLWTHGPQAGWFVLSAGGYHPNYGGGGRPLPRPAPLGFSWSPGGGITASGQIYGAVTSNTSMFGGRLSLDYSSGGGAIGVDVRLKAWLALRVDAVSSWKPFAVHGTSGLRVGAEATVKVLFIRVRVSGETGADLEFWGPRFGASVTVKFWFISFTLPIGNKRPSIPGITWPELLVQLHRPVSIGLEDGLLADAAPSEITARARRGAPALVSRDGFTLTVDTALPLTLITLNGQAYTLPDGSFPDYGPTPSIRPMRAPAITVEARITLTKDGIPFEPHEQRWHTEPVTQRLPNALWGPLPSSPNAPLTEEPLLEERPTGLRITVPPPETGTSTGPVTDSTLATEPLPHGNTPLRDPDPQGPRPSTDPHTLDVIAETIATLTTHTDRTTLHRHLTTHIPAPNTNPTTYAAQAPHSHTHPPLTLTTPQR